MDSSEIVIGVVSGFTLGVASSAAIAIPVYRQQKKDAAESEQRLVLLIEQQLRVSADAFSTVRELGLQNEELKRSFSHLRADVVAASRTQAQSLISEYADVARSLAADRASAIASSDDLPEELTVNALQHLHRQLFPPGYELAGRLRSVQVWIGSIGSTPKTAHFLPPGPSEVSDRTTSLTRDWSRRVPALRKASSREQAFEIARFHHTLVSVHPFLDGNGVLARVVTALQCKQLTGRKAELIRRDAEYIAALKSADSGDYDMLSRLIEGKLLL